MLARWLVRGAITLLIAAMLLFVFDFVVWRIRVAAGGGMGQVDVTQMTAAELKGNKDAYFLDGTVTQACSRSIFPQGGTDPCWWLRRHTQVIQQY